MRDRKVLLPLLIAALAGLLALGATPATAEPGEPGKPAEPGKAESSITVESLFNPVTLNRPLVLVATVTPSSATGTVRFSSDGLPVATIELRGGKATTSPLELGFGYHRIEAEYAGDETLAASTAATYVHDPRSDADGDGVITHSARCGADERYLVPAEHASYRADIVVEGANGGGYETSWGRQASASGGRGAQVSGSIDVVAGETFTVQVGCLPERTTLPGLIAGDEFFEFSAAGGSAYAAGGKGGPSHANVNQVSSSGGGGGGASAVLLGARTLLVGGGGGGAGGFSGHTLDRNITKNGGDAGLPGTAGQSCSRDQGGGRCTGGSPGSVSTTHPTRGADGVASPCLDFNRSQGGSGGGGGGYVGGGSGTWHGCDAKLIAPGGGGGLSYIDPSMSQGQHGPVTLSGFGNVRLTLTPIRAARITVTSDVAGPKLGDRVRFAAQVTAGSDDDRIPTGRVTFFSGATQLGSATLDADGRAVSEPTDRLPGGTFPVTVRYSGDDTLDPIEHSDAIQVSRGLADGTIMLEADPQETTWQTSMSTVLSPASPGDPVPTGQVQFFFDGRLAGPVQQLDDRGAAAVTFERTAPLADHFLWLEYSGDSNYVGRRIGDDDSTTGADTSVRVITPSTTIHKRLLSRPITFGAEVTAVSDIVREKPTGVVRFSIDGRPLTDRSSQPIGEIELVDGTATTSLIDPRALPNGQIDLEVSYLGADGFEPSSGRVTLTVIQDFLDSPPVPAEPEPSRPQPSPPESSPPESSPPESSPPTEAAPGPVDHDELPNTGGPSAAWLLLTVPLVLSGAGLLIKGQLSRRPIAGSGPPETTEND